MGWNLADVWEAAAEEAPDRAAHLSGDRVVTWGEFDSRADALAGDLLDAGLTRQGKVAAYLHNGPEYMIAYAAAFKAAGVPVNVNYRYGASELVYLLDNADAEAVVFDASFADQVEAIRDRLPGVRRWYCAGGSCPPWAADLDAVTSGTAPRPDPSRRSPDDILLLYTGGTTGMPKGVMWRQEDLFMVLGGGGSVLTGLPPAAGMDELRSRLRSGEAASVVLPACPQMHGTGQFTSFMAMNLGGTVVTLPGGRFDPAAVWDAVERRRVQAVAIVGDAFARPLLAALDANPGRWDLSSLGMISSSGVMWSQEVKEGLQRHLPAVVLFDSLGSSEAVGMAGSITLPGTKPATAQFALGAGVRVLTDQDRDVAPGSGEVGIIALPGFIPLGYYKDPDKTARTFRVIDGTRYTIPGDCATVDADGVVRLLGRGSVVINTGGEKVFPEEVEEAIKRLPGVADAVCVGLPDERFGETVCALVEVAPGASVTAEEVSAAVRAELAGYKVPRAVFFLDAIDRSPAGKVDYPGLKNRAVALAAGRPGATPGQAG